MESLQKKQILNKAKFIWYFTRCSGAHYIYIKTLKCTSTPLTPSVLKAFHYQHDLFHFQYILSVPKAFRLVHKAFRFILKKFRLKCHGFIRSSSGSFIVIIKMANWHRSQKLTPFIWRIILLLHISGLFLLNCTDLQVNFESELDLQVRQVFSSICMIELGRILEKTIF